MNDKLAYTFTWKSVALRNHLRVSLMSGRLGVPLQDERSVRQAAIKQYPVLKAATGFEYGYKIMVCIFAKCKSPMVLLQVQK